MVNKVISLRPDTVKEIRGTKQHPRETDEEVVQRLYQYYVLHKPDLRTQALKEGLPNMRIVHDKEGKVEKYIQEPIGTPVDPAMEVSEPIPVEEPEETPLSEPEPDFSEPITLEEEEESPEEEVEIETEVVPVDLN